MLCDRCAKKKAAVHITKMVKGVKQEYNLCEDCAKELEVLNKKNEANLAAPFTFQDILSDIMDYMYQPEQNEKAEDSVCKNCGMTYGEFKASGNMGCSECYNYFDSTITPVIKRVQGNTWHTGKVPGKGTKDIPEKPSLKKLQEELKEAILCEEYEKAAELRDKIREIKKDVEL